MVVTIIQYTTPKHSEYAVDVKCFMMYMYFLSSDYLPHVAYVKPS